MASASPDQTFDQPSDQPNAKIGDILHTTFGYRGFRGQQEAVIRRVMAGKHTLALMPTGAGKSLCYQLPALARAGTTIVLSPLIALMHDQIRAARALGIRAASMTSADSDNAVSARALREGALDLLYVAPERATTPAFQQLLEEAQIALFAIDEAHCVSEWGHDFRPDYRLLRPLLDRFEAVPRLALTATADKTTREDILHQLGIAPEGMVIAGFDRPNIRYTIKPRDNAGRQIAEAVRETPGAGIIYATSRKATEQIAETLRRSGCDRKVGVYHAGLPAEERAQTQAEFVHEEDMVIVATIAFGMGIDKADVRFVIHAGLPKSIEAYYQETGRAGRDGDPSEALLLWSANDFSKARQWLADVEPHRLVAERARLNALAGLVETPGCRRAILLRHFGESPGETCGNCDNCLSPPRILDVSEIAQKLLSAVYRTGQSFGIGHIEKVLTGKSDDRVSERGHDRLSVFGILSGEDAGLLRPVMRSAIAHEMLVTTEHGGLALGPEARAVLRAERRVEIAEIQRKRRGRSGRSSCAAPMAGNPLYEALRAKRSALAKEQGLPAYVVFHDAVLRDMAMEQPATLEAMGALPGIGAKKLATYGADFCAVIREFAD